MKFLPQAEDVPAAGGRRSCRPRKSRYRAGRGSVQSVRNFFPAKRTTCRFFIYICLEDIFEEKHVQQPHGSELVVALIGFK